MVPWQPVIDGDVIPARPIDRIAFVYEFAWPSKQFDGLLGACHGLEIASSSTRWDAKRSQSPAPTHRKVLPM